MTRRVTREGYDVDLVGKLELHDPLAYFKRHGFTYVPDLISCHFHWCIHQWRSS